MRSSRVRAALRAGPKAAMSAAGAGAAAAADAATGKAAKAKRRSNPNGGRPEPELQRAVEDLDRPPARFDSAPAYEAPPMERPIIDRPYNQPPVSPAPQSAAPPQAAAPAEPEPPRRRSTIREPAPIGAAGAPPSPAPSRAAADPGDLLDGERGERPTQARLVGQAPVGRQGLARARTHEIGLGRARREACGRSLWPRPASRATWRCAFIPRASSAATPNSCCMAAATHR